MTHLAFINSRLINLAQSLQDITQDVEAMSKAPQVESVEGPPWALQLRNNTNQVLALYGSLRNDVDSLRNGLEDMRQRQDVAPPWAVHLLDKNKELLEENKHLQSTMKRISSENAQIIARLDAVSIAPKRLDSDAHNLGGSEAHLPLSNGHQAASDLNASNVTQKLPEQLNNAQIPPPAADPGKIVGVQRQSSNTRQPEIKGGTSQDLAALARQWETARSKNRLVAGSLKDPFAALTFFRHTDSTLEFPRTHAHVTKRTTPELRALLSAYDQPTEGKVHAELIADFLRFIGVQDKGAVPEGPAGTTSRPLRSSTSLKDKAVKVAPSSTQERSTGTISKKRKVPSVPAASSSQNANLNQSTSQTGGQSSSGSYYTGYTNYWTW